ncbi:hypothetical protein IRJ41_018416, partial [Triplophysa rosa]
QRGGRGRIFSDGQEIAIVDVVTANNAIKLREIRDRVLADNITFGNMNMDEATVPFERNFERVKELRCQYVQRVMEMEASRTPHTFIFVDEAGFNLAKTRRGGRNVIGQRATVDVPGQRGANITMCAALSNDGLLLHKPLIGPFNTERLISFLNDLHNQRVPAEERRRGASNCPTFIVVWDRVAFHHSAAVTDWFAAHPRMSVLFLPPYLNPIEEFFSAWRWKVYDHHPHDQMTLLEEMNAGCGDISPEDCQGWIRHSRRYFPRCIAREDIRCDVDENLWPNARERED